MADDSRHIKAAALAEIADQDSAPIGSGTIKAGAPSPDSDHDGFSLHATLLLEASGSAQDDAYLPAVLGRYRIVGVLGTGASGIVYRGYDDQLARDVAVKVPHRHLIPNAADIDAYLAEARNLARLDHPGIVPVFDVGAIDERCVFVVSRFVAGGNLAQRIRAEAVSPADAAELVALVAEALHHAHLHGLVHRDVKPANIVLTESGRPLLADFGLALAKEEVGTGPRFAGTLAYMSPEQARGEGHLVDGRSDIFSLGIVFYELLTGTRPFRGVDAHDLAERIKTWDPPPLRQVRDSVPKELERICLKALAKRATERYLTGSDMADDLHCWLRSAGKPAALAEAAGAARRAGDDVLPSHEAAMSEFAKVVPKGLRAFEPEDADFFLDLLPGPTDRHGLPESVHFWKSRIESSDPGQTFRVGVMYGPSGCGKSSLLKAGVLPRLGPQVLPVFVEAAAGLDTEAQLLLALRKRAPSLSPDLTLTECLAAIRVHRPIGEGTKILLVIDQFEQCLHGTFDDRQRRLVEALRQCDGAAVQCVLLVRDDFWMGITRFMQELEIDLAPGRNTAAVDLFPVRHARKVLAAFGRAFGALPDSPYLLTGQQQAFLKQAVDELARDGTVVPVRLALFAEMLKSHDWTPKSLKALGGIRGVGVAFLEHTFASAAANPAHRRHRPAAERVLHALLPDSGADIRGHHRTYEELRQASGYGSEAEFHELLRILGAELPLLSPLDLTDAGGADALASNGSFAARRYQLTHDYLVPAVREWLNRRQRQSVRGRARLRLEEWTALSSAGHQQRHLPGVWIWLHLVLWTRSRDWTKPQAEMMRAASRRHLTRGVFAAAALVLMLAVGWQARRRFLDEQYAREAAALVQRVLDAETAELPKILPELEPIDRWTNPLLEQTVDDPHASRKARLHASLALAQSDATQAEFLKQALLQANPRELLVIREAIGTDAADFFWQVLRDPESPSDERFRAGCALAGFAPTDRQWPAAAGKIAVSLVGQSALQLKDWIEALRPVSGQLVQPLTVLYSSPKYGVVERRNAAHALAEYCGEDVDRLTQLLLIAEPAQFSVLLPRLAANPTAADAFLERAVTEKESPQWNDPAGAWPEPPPEAAGRVNEAAGIMSEHWALCQTMPLESSSAVAEALRSAGYRPISFRPYRSQDAVRVAAVWRRDGLDWRLAIDQTAEQLARLNNDMRSAGFLPVDVADDDPPGDAPAVARRFAALWSKGQPGLVDAQLYLMVPSAEHHHAWGPLNRAGFVPRTNLLITDRGQEFFTSVRWQLRPQPGYGDEWHVDERGYQRRQSEGSCQADVRLTDFDTEDARPRFAGCWWSRPGYGSQESHGLPPQDHLQQCRRFADEGYRPVSLSVRQPAGVQLALTASVWQRPDLIEVDRDRFASRQANAVIALFRQGETSRLWPSLAHAADPRLRTYLIHRLGPLGASADLLIERLPIETDVSVRRAILLALSRFDPAELPAAQRAAMTNRASQLYREDCDPGIHAAAEFLLRQSGVDAAGEGKLARNLSDTRGDAVSWYVDGQGHTLVTVRGPVVYSMGASHAEPGRNISAEKLHHQRIGRSFAVAAKEVTVEQYRRFDPAHYVSPDHTPDADCPVVDINWYAAARYCRWLSEQEGVSEDQMCFPPTDQIREGMRLPADYLRRTGYRLPTEAEWEFVCRAGAQTSRFYGETEELLNDYAWTFANSQNRLPDQLDSHYRSWPVGTRMPNDLGMFDILGNAMEWCQEQYREYAVYDDRATEDLEDTDAILNLGRRSLRGGAFLYQPSDARSSHRDHHPTATSAVYLGFRVARTLGD